MKKKNPQNSDDGIKPISAKERAMCLGKTKHRSELAAREQLDHLRSDTCVTNKATLGYYKCDFCDGWHCGNSLKNLK